MARPHRAGRRAALIGTVLAGLSLSACADDPGPTGPVPGLRPTVLGVEPGVVEAGGSATIRGLNFPASAPAVDVEFAGREATVTSASETSLAIDLPEPAELPCRPTRRVQLQVAAAGRSDTARHRFSVAPPVHLEPGESRAFLSSDDRLGCREFPAVDGEYLVSVFNTSRSPSQRLGFEVRGSTGAGEPDSTTAATVSASRAGGLDRSGAGRIPAALRKEVRAGVGHRRIVEANRRLLERARRPAGGADPGGAATSGGGHAAVSGAPGVSAQQAPPQVGEHVDFRVPDLNSGGSICENYVTVTGRVAHVTEHAVLVSDTANPIDGEYDDRLREMGSEFEDRMWPVITDNFGDPLRMDPQLNDDGHLYMLFTPEVNDFGNALAFVFAGDFFPRTSSDSTQLTCASSDTAEVFYSRAPTELAPDGYDRLAQTGQWKRVLRSTLVHEVKHLASNAERISRDLPPETTWLEESTAHAAEELYARRVFGVSQGSNATYDQTVYCAVRPTVAECEGTPYVMVSEFVWLADYLRSTASLSAVDAAAPGATFRGSGWWLLRWALDHAQASESQFLSAMTTSPLTGIENLEARVGRSWAEILADWTLSLAVDDRSSQVEREELTVPTWNVRDIFRGFHRDFGSQGGLFGEPYPLDTRSEDYGSFTRSVAGLPGGSGAIFRLTGSGDATQLVEIAPLSGDVLPPELRISVARLPR